jgi:hypothetical protein
VETLAETGRFAECLDRSTCARASRMPLLPVGYALIWRAGARSLVSLGVVKNLVLAAVLLPCLAYHLAGETRRRWRWLIAAGLSAVFLSPYYLRTAADVQAEEALLYDLLLAATFLLLGITRRMAGGRAVHPGVPCALAGIGCALYLLKSSTLLAAACLVLAGAVLGCRGRPRTRAIVLAMFAGTIVGWGVRNQVTTGRFSIGTSFDGSNLYRGWHPLTARLYPEVSLDRLINTPAVELADGQVIRVPATRGRETFANEWAWSDHYRADAIRWARGNPADLLAVTAEKAWVFFADVRAYPVSAAAGFRRRDFAAWMQGAGMAWMGLVRLAQLSCVVLLVLLFRASRREGWLASAPVPLLAAYAIPCLIGFAYQRHTTAWACVVLVVAIDLAARISALRATGEGMRKPLPHPFPAAA